jgi:hypothetical protein
MLTRYLTYSTTLLGFTAAYVTPRVATSDDGFPGPNAKQLLNMEQQANGLLSSLPPPPKLSAAGITNFQLIAFNENLEVSFFDSIIKNITDHVPGFEYKSASRSEAEIVEILKTVKAVSAILS